MNIAKAMMKMARPRMRAMIRRRAVAPTPAISTLPPGTGRTIDDRWSLSR
jgi:hypothetical protein